MAQFVIDVLDQDLKSKARGQHQVEFADDATAQEAIESIVFHFELPQKDFRGEDRRYMLGYQGQMLNPDEVIAQRAPSGATLVLASDAGVAGTRA